MLELVATALRNLATSAGYPIDASSVSITRTGIAFRWTDAQPSKQRMRVLERRGARRTRTTLQELQSTGLTYFVYTYMYLYISCET